MISNMRSRTRLITSILLIFTFLTLSAASPTVQQISKKQCNLTVADVELLGEVVFETGYMYADTEVGGLSGITYNHAKGLYYALSDDRSETNPSRFYRVKIDLSDGSLDDGDVIFKGVTFLRDKHGDFYPERAIDPEGIELVRPGLMFISTEGDDIEPPIDPFVNRFNPGGRENRALPIPGKFLYSVDDGNAVRDNLAFESLTSTPNRKYLYTATENALQNDGPIASLTEGSPSRFLEFNVARKKPGREFVYMVDPIPNDTVPPGGYADNGLVDLQAIDNCGTFLAMERSYASGFGNTVVLYETTTRGATNVAKITALAPDGTPSAAYTPMSKRFILDFELDLGVDPDNLEGLTFGPRLPDGRLLLIAVSDNNFNPYQKTQFIAMAVTLEK